jgi:deoxyribodipyrimidine photo-lyase
MLCLVILYASMYWANKILEWCATPNEALVIANYFNDRYSVDGRDPLGYIGTAQNIGGLHDKPLDERPIFGTTRYFGRWGCDRKFSVPR